MDIGTRIGRHRQHRQWEGVWSTIEVPMLPMSAYVAAYVHLLPEMRGAYVPMCFSGFWPGEPVDTDKLDKLDKTLLHFPPLRWV